MGLPNQPELLKQFSSFLVEAGLSAVSIKNYLSDIRHFLNFSESSSSTGEGTTTPASSEKIFRQLSQYLPPYLEAQKATYTPQSTTNRRLASIRRFATFLSVKFDIQDIFTHQNTSNNNKQSNQISNLSGFQRSDQTASLPPLSSTPYRPPLTSSAKTLSSEKILEQFKSSLEREEKTHSTIKNYLSDLNHFFLWTANQTPFTTQNLFNILSESHLQAYLTYLKLSHTSTSVINRRLSSIKKLARFCHSEGYLPKNPFEVKSIPQKLAPLAWIERLSHKPTKTSNGSRNRFQLWYDRYNALTWTPYLNIAILVLVTTAMAIFAYNQIISQARPSAAATALTPPKRQLSFQGRLTDSSGTPITTAVNVVFKLFNQLAPPGTQLYTSGTCSITPDQSGIFNSLIGDGVCGAEITSSVFTDNRDVFLEIQVGAETLTPRQQIATVGYAINSSTLQGYPASASATINTVPVVDNSGNITIAATSPSLISSSGTFTIKGESLALQTAANSGGDIVLQPDSIGSGQILAIGGTTTEDSFRITNANLTGGTLLSGYVGNDTATGRLLSLTSGSTETDRFWVATDGRTGIFASDADSALIVNQTGTGNLISASVSGSPVFTVTNGGNVDITGQYLVNGVPLGGGSSNWQLTSGSLAPLQITNSVNIGAIATASALVHLAGTSGENSFINTGSVGIGKTNPLATLDVTGTASVSGNLTIGFNSHIQPAYGPLYFDFKSGPNTYTNSLLVSNTGDLTPATDNTYYLGSPTATWKGIYFSHSMYDSSGNAIISLDSTPNKRLFSSWEVYNGNFTVDTNSLFVDATTHRVGIGDISPNSLLTVGDGDLFQVNSSGDIVKINNVTTSFPSSQGAANSVLTNDGTGTLSWFSPISGSGINGFWQRTSGSLAPTNITDSLNLGATATASALVHLAGTVAENSWINTGNVGIGNTNPIATLTVGSGDKFQVDGATGNITTAGDLAVNGDDITADGTLNILGATGLTLQATTGTINIGTGTGTDTINIGTGATGSDVISIGGGVGSLTINTSEFDISGTTGAITIDDTGNAGSVNIEGTILDINSLGFVGAGTINSGAGTAITINPNSGDVAAEDLIITANNVGLDSSGNLTLGGTSITASSLATITTSSDLALGGATTLTFTADNATIYGSNAASGDLTLDGTNHATKTSSYIILQPNGGNVGIGTSAPTATLEILADVDTPSGNALEIQAAESADLNDQDADDVTFTNATTCWTYGAGWARTGGVAQHTVLNTADLSCNLTAGYIDNNQIYRITFDMGGRTAGTVTPKIGTATHDAITTNASYDLTFDATANDADIIFTPDSNFNGYIDNVHIYRAAVNTAISDTGRVGVGRNPTYFLDVLAPENGIIARFLSDNSTGCTLATGGTISCTSDIRLKKNVDDVSYGLDTIMDLRPVSFDWKGGNSAFKNLGFIAQEVETIIPNLVSIDQDNGYKQLNTTGLIPVLTKAIQQQQSQITSLAQNISSNFQAGVAVVRELTVDNLVVRGKLISPIADIDQLKVIDATVTGTLYADSIKGKTVDNLNTQLDLLNEKYSTASAILADLQAKYTSYDSLSQSTNHSEPITDSDPLALSPLATSSAETIITGDILASGSVFSQSFGSIDSDLFIQPTGDRPVHLLGNLLSLYPDGKVVINGDLIITGTLYANNLDTKTATISGTLAIGSSTIASGSANFGELTTSGLVIASENDHQSSTISAQVNSNATIGTATIATGSAEIAIANNKVTDNTLIYVTPVTDTGNQVLYVKSKQSGVGFTVATPLSNTSEISFNFWLVQTK